MNQALIAWSFKITLIHFYSLLIIFLGAAPDGRKKMSSFRQFLEIVSMNRGVWSSQHERNEHSQALLFLMKLAKGHSFDELATLFTVARKTATRTFEGILLNHYRFHCNIRNIVDLYGRVQHDELNRLLQINNQ